MTQFHVELKRVVDDSYNIEIGRQLFPKLVEDINHGLIKNVNRLAILSDSVVSKFYGDKLLHLLKEAGYDCHLFTVPNGEKTKNRETKTDIEDQMLALGYGRDSAIIALGGGMISDLSGFIASTFCRGIPYINYSTTLLSAADASVGGKTAVNTPVATNLIGTFYQPTKVYIDLDTWQTLPLREFRSGLAETIKHACLADSDFFSFLETHMEDILTSNELILNANVCSHVAYKNCDIKFHVVEKDEKESNLRQILNLGHTAGRALEALSGYTLLHGEAIAVGLVIQAKIANQLGLLEAKETVRVYDLLKKAGFNLTIPENITPDALVKKMYTDKKVRNGQIRFVLMSKIGQMKQFDDGSYSVPVSEDLIYQAIQSL
ncbi:3-dehydroquinate synthase [Terrilactibacillus sp. BCM23-1]|uniref:3-dehydroquinate synthase n=1 Tax=Terrilactibacillus tamarindi TaxID=2599694 RepID=A0A6N8CMX5_9BACI|nr:3-dehydroquinate synthase [Terrilactibacillus tamarindi]MTT30433.1 3-dehydroquinate synthase [Terrilactibacillus tamarindi]